MLPLYHGHRRPLDVLFVFGLQRYVEAVRVYGRGYVVTSRAEASGTVVARLELPSILLEGARLPVPRLSRNVIYLRVILRPGRVLELAAIDVHARRPPLRRGTERRPHGFLVSLHCVVVLHVEVAVFVYSARTLSEELE